MSDWQEGFTIEYMEKFGGTSDEAMDYFQFIDLDSGEK